MKRLTQENFRERIRLLEQEVSKTELAPGNESSTARLCEMIGNICWHFAPSEADAWFLRTRALRRKAGWVPDWRSALTSWKLQDILGFRRDCAQAKVSNQRALNEAVPLSGDTFKDRERERAILRTANDLAVVLFLLEEYDEALRTIQLGMSESARWAEWDQASTDMPFGSSTFLTAMSNALLHNDLERANEALTALLDVLPLWPSDAGGQAEELYRYGLALRDQYFPSNR